MLKYVFLLVLAVVIFSTQVYRPIDGTSRNVWREVDVGSMARNFSQEGMNILYPQIDWRGAGPGYVESEFPILAWLGGALYKVFGYHEWLLRLISMLAMLGSCALFFLLARMLLNESAAFLASFIFVLHPLVFLLATAIQPEPLMFFTYLSAIYCFLRWIQSDHLKFYFLALFSTTIAVLAKIPAAHVGIFFVLLALQRFGWKAFVSPMLWFFVFFCLGVPLAWYYHARSLWLEYGNSLGISNEAYTRVGHTTLTDFLKVNIWGNFAIEVKKIWMIIGSLLGFAGAFSFARNNKGTIILFWGISLILYYLIAGGTTGEDWASYYHVPTVPLACILIAEGFYFLKDNVSRYLANGLLLTAVCVEIGVIFYVDFIRVPPAVAYYLTAQRFKPQLTQEGLIVASGGASVDAQGRPAAGNAPYYFFWLDRKGFSLYANEGTMEHLMDLKKQGARYFVIEKSYVKNNPIFYRKVFATFKVLDETDSAYLIDLGS